MIGSKDPQEVLNPQPKITSLNCPSSHGTSGFLQGTTYDQALGRFVCVCGRQYTSNLDKPDWIINNGTQNPQTERRRPLPLPE